MNKENFYIIILWLIAFNHIIYLFYLIKHRHIKYNKVELLMIYFMNFCPTPTLFIALLLDKIYE
jgi:hypothetical protein